MNTRSHLCLKTYRDRWTGKIEWPECTVCDGRVHLPECTTNLHPDKLKDCCPERHKMLHDAGQVRGLADSSFLMWTPENPWGKHSPERKQQQGGNS